MTISTTSNNITYAIDGSTTEFAFTFTVYQSADVTCYLVDSSGTETAYTDFSVVLNDNNAGGTVTTNTTLTTDDGVSILIIRETEQTQELDLIEGGKFPSDSMEDSLDKLTMLAQDRQTQLSNALQKATSNSQTIGVAVLTDDKVVGYDGENIVSGPVDLDQVDSISARNTAISNAVAGLSGDVTVLKAVATANNTTLDDVAYLTATGTYTGQHYFYLVNTETTYYCAAGITDTLTSYTVNSDYNTVTATSSSTTYTLINAEVFSPIKLSQSLGWIRTSQLGIVSASSTDYLDDELRSAVSTYKYLIIDTEIYVNTYDSNNTVISLDMDGQMLMGTIDGAIIAGSDNLAGQFIITTTGDNIVIDHVTLKNPERYGEGDNPVCGFRVRGQNTTVQYCTTEYCGQTYLQYWSNSDDTLVVRNTRFLFNNALNNIGNGDAGADPSSSLGESTGDAFTAWGGTCTMFGNYASAASGADCRIAFHCEGINHASETDNIEQGAFHIVSHNRAIGPFRRHFVLESVDYCTVTGNKSEGGMAWWNYAVIGGSSDTDLHGHNMLIDNFAYYDIPSTLTNGAYWSPNKAALGFLNYQTDNLVDGFHVVMSDDAYSSDVIFSCENGNNYNLTLKNIDIDISGSGVTVTTGYVINILGGNHTKATFENIKVSDDNDVSSYLINVYNADDSLTLRDVYIDGSMSVCNVQGVIGNLRFMNIEHLDDTGGTGVIFYFPSSENSNVIIDGYILSGSTTSRPLTNTYNGLAGLVVKNVTSSNAQLTMELNGSAAGGEMPGTYSLDYNTIKGVTADFYHSSGLLTDATSVFNTIGKRAGRTVIVNTAGTYAMYIAQGSSATSNWISTDSNTTVTPA